MEYGIKFSHPCPCCSADTPNGQNYCSTCYFNNVLLSAKMQIAIDKATEAHAKHEDRLRQEHEQAVQELHRREVEQRRAEAKKRREQELERARAIMMAQEKERCRTAAKQRSEAKKVELNKLVEEQQRELAEIEAKKAYYLSLNSRSRCQRSRFRKISKPILDTSPAHDGALRCWEDEPMRFDAPVEIGDEIIESI